MRQSLFVIPLAFGIFGLTTSAWADDWIAQKLRGEALVFANGSWVKLKRGDIVNNSNVVRTMGDGQIEFVRDHETITLGPNTQIQIFDKTGRRYTTVAEPFGSVRIEANVENVKHFAVQTPFLAATVKGTIFTVVANARGSKVKVQRGKVRVDDVLHHLHVDVIPGQVASVGPKKVLQISGTGTLAPVVNAADQPAPSDSNKGKHGGNAGGNGNNNAGGNGKGNAGGKGNGDGKGNGNGHGNGNGKS